jgi:hypothetical protein
MFMLIRNRIPPEGDIPVKHVSVGNIMFGRNTSHGKKDLPYFGIEISHP